MLKSLPLRFLPALCLCLVLCAAPALAADIAINESNFPDPEFRSYVQTLSTDHDNVLSDAERNAVTDISVQNEGIRDLTGIEHFPNLKELNCYENALTRLDVSRNTALTALYVYDNDLTALDLSQNTLLENLSCHSNRLTALDLSHNTALDYLACQTNALASLDLSFNADLDYLDCSGNRLTDLDLPHNTQLYYLDCSGNWLTDLDLTANTGLLRLDCSGNRLTDLDLTDNSSITTLNCSGQTREHTVPQGEDRLDLTALVDDWSRVTGPSATGGTLDDGDRTLLRAGVAESSTVTYAYATGYNGQTMDVALTVRWPEVYRITADPASLDFGDLTQGDPLPAPRTVTVTNTGNRTLTLTEPGGTDHFTVGTLGPTVLAPGGAASFTVAPRAGLSAGTYNDILTLTASGGVQARVTLRLTVTAPTVYDLTPDTQPAAIQDPGGGEGRGFRAVSGAFANLLKLRRIAAFSLKREPRPRVKARAQSSDAGPRVGRGGALSQNLHKFHTLRPHSRGRI